MPGVGRLWHDAVRRTYVLSAFGPESPLRDILYETAIQETRWFDRALEATRIDDVFRD